MTTFTVVKDTHFSSVTRWFPTCSVSETSKTAAVSRLHVSHCRQYIYLCILFNDAACSWGRTTVASSDGVTCMKWMNNWKWHQRSGRGLCQKFYLGTFLGRDFGKIRKTLVRTADLRAEIWTRDLTITKQGCFLRFFLLLPFPSCTFFLFSAFLEVRTHVFTFRVY